MKLPSNFFAIAAVVVTTGVAAAASAQNIACNSTYTTARGDSLSDIAERAYNNPRAYQNIFDVNPGVLTSPNIVPIGVDLYIPCENSGTSNPGGGLPEIKASVSDEIMVLTGRDYAPYVGDRLPYGGFSTELLERALQMNDQPANYEIDVVGDWGSHLQTLLANGAYDIGYPWYQPDCSNTAPLGDESTWRCENLMFSEPMHEIVVSFFGRQGEVEDISSPQDAYGMTICRPQGYFAHDLEAAGLVEPNITRVTPATPKECFEMLAAQTADLVSVNVDTADRMIQELEMSDRTAEVIDLSTIQTLHAVGMRNNPQSRILMRRIDQGLKGIQDQDWFREIAAHHL